MLDYHNTREAVLTEKDCSATGTSASIYHTRDILHGGPM